MTETIETVQLDETHRLTIRYDQSSEDPRSWGNEELPDAILHAWQEGEVYGVTLEELVSYTRDGSDQKMTQWEELDSLWGNYELGYASLEDMAKHVADDHFPVEITF